MFLGQIFAKNAKNDPKTLFEASKSVKKNKIRKISVKSRNDIFIFSHILQHILSNILYGFLKILILRGKILKKKKLLKFLEFLGNFQNFENPR